MNDVERHTTVQKTLDQLFEVLTKSRSDLFKVRCQLATTRASRTNEGHTEPDPRRELEELNRLKNITDVSDGLGQAQRLAYQAAGQLEGGTT